MLVDGTHVWTRVCRHVCVSVGPCVYAPECTCLCTHPPVSICTQVFVCTCVCVHLGYTYVGRSGVDARVLSASSGSGGSEEGHGHHSRESGTLGGMELKPNKTRSLISTNANTDSAVRRMCEGHAGDRSGREGLRPVSACGRRGTGTGRGPVVRGDGLWTRGSSEPFRFRVVTVSNRPVPRPYHPSLPPRPHPRSTVHVCRTTTGSVATEGTTT